MERLEFTLVVPRYQDVVSMCCYFFFFSSRRRHTRFKCDWSSDVCSSDLRLRLDDRIEVPQPLRDALCSLQVRLGRTEPAAAPATLHAAHDLVFAVQQRLMAANPKHPRPNRHAGRPGGQPVITVLRDGGLWKLLTLPPPPASGPDDAWLELIECTVERAWDRWSYAQQHAVRAAQERYKPHVPLP